MGMFDTVYVSCPECREELAFQSKSGDCCCIDYDLEDAPQDVLIDVNRHSPHTCPKCQTQFKVILMQKIVPKVVKV
jgi:hypothetical protein